MSEKLIVSSAYMAEQGIKEATLRFVTETKAFERVVTTEGEGDNVWDEVVCEEIVANDDILRIELLDDTGAAIADVYMPGGFYWNTLIKVTVQRHENANYANLGSSSLAGLVAADLKAEFAGHYLRNAAGEYLYYNGACDGAEPSIQEAYQHLVNKVLA